MCIRDSYRALIKTDLKKIIKSLDINGSDYFDESFIDTYIAENIMDINPDLK